MELRLETSEVTLLLEALRYDLGELRMEIVGTDSYALRQELKQREQVFKSLIDRLEQLTAVAT